MEWGHEVCKSQKLLFQSMNCVGLNMPAPTKNLIVSVTQPLKLDSGKNKRHCLVTAADNI